jgi:hypothetical protein
MALRYWVGAAGTWDASDTSHWAASSGGASGASVPTSIDGVAFDGNSGGTFGVVIGANVSCKSLSFAGPYVSLNLQGTYAINVAGNINLYRTTIVNPPATGALVIAANCTFTSGGVDARDVVIAGGTTTLADDLLCSGSLTCSSGVFNTAGYAVTVGRFKSSSSSASAVLNGSVVTVTGSGVAWEFVSGTLSAGTSTIKFANASAADRSFKGGGKTYYNVWFSGAYTGTLDIQDSNTFNEFRSDYGEHVIQFAVSSTQTVNALTLGGTSAGALTTLQSEIGTLPWNLSCPGGSIVCEWLILKDSHAAGGATFTATSSADGGGNSGWSIVAPVTPPRGDRRVRLTYIRR